jgi:hypothetical protein
LLLVEDVLENYPDVDGRPPREARAVRRTLQLAGVRQLPAQQSGESQDADDLWPVGTVRVFFSHLAGRKKEVHDLAEVLRKIGFSCFVAHDEIKPSRSWLREIERALRSCDLLVAYISPKFAESDWTDQEVGWALGRDLVVIPISVDGEMPKGFLGSYQAVRHSADQRPVSLGREVCKAIVDAVFEEQRPAARAVRDRVAALISRVFCKVRSHESARFWYALLVRIPASEFTSKMRSEVQGALTKNAQLAGAVLADHSKTPMPDAVASYLGW